MRVLVPILDHHIDSGRRFPLHYWRFDNPVRAIASGVLGGGFSRPSWVINATVHREYARMDPDAHLAQLARERGLAGEGVGLMTAVDVRDAMSAADGGVEVVATVGLGHPTWAAAPDGDLRHERPAPVGTINLVCWVPAVLSSAALVNAVVTVTEAKVQALLECGVEATGTASDAVLVACSDAGETALWGGPRSEWGSRLARAVYRSVTDGTRTWYGSPG